VHWVDRGGDVTYHGPGQLIGYPLLPLAVGGLAARQEKDGSMRLPQADYVGYVRRLERALILALAQLGVVGEQVEGLTGVWVHAPVLRHSPAKIAAIGVKVDARGVSRHGFALNVDPDMAYWDGIVGCGLKDASVASLVDFCDPPPPIEQVMEAVIVAFEDVFGYHMIEVETGAGKEI
jgi:lipoate-protein ligase B